MIVRACVRASSASLGDLMVPAKVSQYEKGFAATEDEMEKKSQLGKSLFKFSLHLNFQIIFLKKYIKINNISL